jgi:TRAP-type C4-dicarboxylate transport system substrate-binding protein
MTLLFGAPFTPQGIWAKIKIRKPEDLAGLKIRTYDVTGLKTLKAAGAAPIQLSWADVVPALSTNVIEGVLTSDESGCNGKFWEYGVKYFNSLGYTMGIAAVFMNMDRYNALSPAMQKAIRDGAKAADDWAWANTYNRVEFNKKRMADGGGVLVDDVPEEVINHVKKAGEPLLGEWMKKMGPDADAIIAEFRKRMGE